MARKHFGSSLLISIVVLLAAVTSFAQDDKKGKPMPKGKAVMWEPATVEERDLFNGPGGTEMVPNLKRIELIKEEKDGHNKKFRIRDGSGRIWVAKLGREAKPETAAVRLLWGIGYKTETNYLVPRITIPGEGTFNDVRLEARPDNIERLDEWKWRDNPFVGTNELEGLKMMMVFLNNWDVLDLQNKVLHVDGELHYIVSDLGSTFGKLGSNNLPVVYRIGRSTGNPEDYMKTKFIDGVENNIIDVAYRGKNRDLFGGFSTGNAAWLAGLLSRLSDKQISDAFRAARYSPDEIELFTSGVKNRISELKRVAGSATTAAN
ncbi:MAG TPA: hypothetical protein VL572_04665 [Pyrinomonadaceae bacterium]|nr:hypothetical protein [Pyrinomonadaceae bacterium]